ncbi:hypothetical protein MNO14_00660 [Luteimonas sp. S4-F44]|uniref:hypothetical protein n=1 Tax=Luteimonas sp. S4-F44 TaxID=2925842 RepID=UPI001F532E11|nr:hypothetical protein [Luteimonas sp. S4-F44]UNK42652.1 hypothetical protein MNO14_00660 [Luteimonas sp. S4-F44]
MRWRPTTVLLLTALWLPAWPASAQQYEIDLSQIDTTAVLSSGGDVLRRAAPEAIDGLFQAVLHASREPGEARALCDLFEPDAARDLAAFQRTVDRLGPASRNRFANAFTQVALTGLQGPPQAFDPAAAQQVLRAAAVTATLLHDGFMLGLTSTGTDEASRAGRCRAFRQMVDVLKDQPQTQRVLATRWLLAEGLTLVADGQPAAR